MPKNDSEFRKIDDKIVEAIKELDKAIDHILEIIVGEHPEFVIDFLIGTTYQNMAAGGVRIFSGSRKKKSIKYKLLNLILYIKDKTIFMEKVREEGLIRGLKEELVEHFFFKFQENYIKFIQVYRDPFPTYQKVYPLYFNYTALKKTITNITFKKLSKTVLSLYSGWLTKRTFESSKDFSNYEEDIQNSSFSIEKALRLFDTQKHKSFFSYASSWVKEGISSAEYIINDEISTISIEDMIVSREPAFEDEENTGYDDTTPAFDIVMENYADLYEIDDISTLHFIKSSYPIPNELRIFFRLLQNLQKR